MTTLTMSLLSIRMNAKPEELHQSVQTGETVHGEGYTKMVMKVAGAINVVELVLGVLPILLHHYLIQSISTIGFLTSIVFTVYMIHDTNKVMHLSSHSSDKILEHHESRVKEYGKNPKKFSIKESIHKYSVMVLRLILLGEIIRILFI